MPRTSVAAQLLEAKKKADAHDQTLMGLLSNAKSHKRVAHAHAHKKQWRDTAAQLAAARQDLEAALAADACVAAAVAGADELGRANDLRDEWSRELRAQLEAAAALVKAAPRVSRERCADLLTQLRRAVDSQGSLLNATASSLEEELHSFEVASGEAKSGTPCASTCDELLEAAQGGAEALAHFAGAFVSPPLLRTEGEERLLAEADAELDLICEQHAQRQASLGLVQEERSATEGDATVARLPFDAAATGSAQDASLSKPERAISRIAQDLAGRPRAELLRRIAAELPDCPVAAAEAWLDTLSRQRFRRLRERALDKAWFDAVHKLASALANRLRAQAVLEEEEARRAKEAAEREGRRRQLDANLAAMGEERARRRAIEAEEDAKAERDAHAEREALARRREMEFARSQALLEAHREAKREAAAEEQARAMEAETRERASASRRAVANRGRVEYRATILRARSDEVAAQAKREQARAAEARARTLAWRRRIETQIGIETDPQRAVAPTAASSVERSAAVDLGPSAARVPGYLDETLMRDMRYKLGAALSEAGLGQTAYARTILTAPALNVPRRRDTVHTLKMFESEM